MTTVYAAETIATVQLTSGAPMSSPFCLSTLAFLHSKSLCDAGTAAHLKLKAGFLHESVMPVTNYEAVCSVLWKMPCYIVRTSSLVTSRADWWQNNKLSTTK
jgi:hypothetical protein